MFKKSFFPAYEEFHVIIQNEEAILVTKKVVKLKTAAVTIKT